MSRIKVIIGDEFPLIRKGIKSQLTNGRNRFEVIEEASTGREFLDILKIKPPDLVIFDSDMPIIDGFRILEIIKQKHSNVKTLMTSFKDDYLTISEAYARGVSGFISKKEENCCIVNAIKQIVREGRYYNKKISDSLLKGFLFEKSHKLSRKNDQLSIREIEILKQLCEGNTHKMVSEKLNISVNTVDFHKKNIFKKTKTNKNADLVKYAIKNQLILLD